MRMALIGIFLLTAGVAVAQECPECAAADACVRNYSRATEKNKQESRKRVDEYRKGMRELKLKDGSDLARRGVEQMEKNLQVQFRLDIEELKKCLAKIG